MTNLTAAQQKVRDGFKKAFTVKVDGEYHDIGIVETPQDVLNVHMMDMDDMIEDRVDGRLLTVMFKVDDREGTAKATGYYLDYIIGVYNYEQFMHNKFVAEAIIQHELGHINNVPPNMYDIDAVRECEYQADEYAVRQVGKDSVLLMLNILRAELHKLESEQLAELMTQRIINIRRYELPSEKKPVQRKGLFSSVVGKLKELF